MRYLSYNGYMNERMSNNPERHTEPASCKNLASISIEALQNLHEATKRELAKRSVDNTLKSSTRKTPSPEEFAQYKKRHDKAIAKSKKMRARYGLSKVTVITSPEAPSYRLPKKYRKKSE